MKTILMAVAVSSLAFLTQSCDDAEARYIDLSTGDEIELRENESGKMVDAETGKPVRVYVDTREKDTIWGETGEVVNGKLIRSDDGEWKLKSEDGEVKIKTDNEGGENGEYKIKSGDYKKEVEKDGDITIKDGKTKIKIDGETGERKVKKDD